MILSACSISSCGGNEGRSGGGRRRGRLPEDSDLLLKVRAELAGLLQLFFELGESFLGTSNSFFETMSWAILILGSLGGLADVVDMIERHGAAKIEEIKRLFLIALTGDVYFDLPTSHVDGIQLPTLMEVT